MRESVERPDNIAYDSSSDRRRDQFGLMNRTIPEVNCMPEMWHRTVEKKSATKGDTNELVQWHTGHTEFVGTLSQRESQPVLEQCNGRDNGGAILMSIQ